MATNAYLATSSNLGRTLTGATTAVVDIVPPSSMFGDRINQLDLRFSRLFRIGGGRRVSANVDLANLLNNNAAVTELFGYNLANVGAWRRPNELLQARFVKFGVNVDF